MRARVGLALLAAAGLSAGTAATSTAAPSGSAAASDPYCTGTYGGAPPRPVRRLRFGVDPGLAGSAGAQLPSTPDNPGKDLSALKALRPPGRVLVLRLNRLFWSDGPSAVARFRDEAASYARAGFDSEIQVRYHPTSQQEGDMAAWTRYVRSLVDALGSNRHVVAMTITNEVNLTFSPNTSDGYYSGAKDALIQGIEAAQDEAVRRHFTQLRFGFTYAYRFSPQGDAAFFAYLAAHGGARFRRALAFVGLDFYPGAVYPPAMSPTDSYRSEFAQAAGTLRDCFMPMAGIGRATPIWITENGISTGSNSDAQQASALSELVTAARDYGTTYGITDYRWFNLRDSSSSGPQTLVGPTFTAFGLLRDDYSGKPAFAAYRKLIYALGTPTAPKPPRRGRARGKHRSRSHRHAGSRRRTIKRRRRTPPRDPPPVARSEAEHPR